MWKKIISVLLLLSLLSSSLIAQSSQWSPILSVERINQLMDELDANLSEQQILIESLLTSNEEQSRLINEQLNSLKASEESLRKQIALSDNLGNLIGDQAIYQRSLERKLLFWRITSGVLAASLAATLIIWGASN